MIDYTKHRAHPTKYQGVQFRSRLEAKWEAFFDMYGVDWEYEPFDLGEWSPDFLVSHSDGSATLVEVKPIKAPDKDVIAKINAATPWDQYSTCFLLGLGPWKNLKYGREQNQVPFYCGWRIRTPDIAAERPFIPSPWFLWGEESHALWVEASNLVQWRSPA